MISSRGGGVGMGCDRSGFEAEGFRGCTMEDDAALAEEEGVFEEERREVMLQKWKRVDYEIYEHIWSEKGKMDEEKGKWNWERWVGWGLYRRWRFEYIGGQRKQRWYLQRANRWILAATLTLVDKFLWIITDCEV